MKSQTNGHPLYRLLDRLDAANIHYTLARYRPGTVIISATFVGKRVEIEYSIFSGDESVEVDLDLLDLLIQQESD